MSGVHHFVPVLHRGDAVGRHTLRLRDATRRRGIESNIFVDVVQDETADETLPALAYAEQAQRGDVVVYQFATASLMAPWLASRRETLVVNYHNITPPDLVAPWDHHLALGQERAREDLAVLAPRTALAIADSAYNETHLAEAGFSATAVVPPSAALGDDATPASSRSGPARSRTGAAPTPGRARPGSPSAASRPTRRSSTRSPPSPWRAGTATLARPCASSASRRPIPTSAPCGATWPTSAWSRPSRSPGTPPMRPWRPPTRPADVLVVTSEHEGFCVPVVEAMAAGLPVVAFDQGAVPEVLGNAGVLVDSRDPYVLADAISTTLQDPARAAALAEAGRRRLAELDLPNAADRFVDLLCGLREDGSARR